MSDVRESFDRLRVAYTDLKAEYERLLGEHRDAVRVLTRLGHVARCVARGRPVLDTDAQTAESIRNELRAAVLDWQAWRSEEDEEVMLR